ncbi:MAG: hypothetical protein RSE41_09580 [Clostridia bacterium]
MAKNASSGSSNRNSPSMKFNNTSNFKSSNQKSYNKSTNFIKGKTSSKPFKNI